MPPVTAPAKVLVTGASGFLATNIIKDLLKAGHTVVGTVRSPSKGQYLEKLYDNNSRFSFTIVEDIGASDAFDETIKNGSFEGIIHTATPVAFSEGNPNDWIEPAVNGTLNILNSALKFGPTVKRFVITSSAITIMPMAPPRGKHVWTEKEWNDGDLRTLENSGSRVPGALGYTGSKILAERAAWDFVEKHKDSISWDISMIHPSYVFGPIIHEVASPEKLNVSHELFFKTVTAKQEDLTEEDVAHYIGGLVDVRTVSKAHTQALVVSEAGGKRFLVSDADWSKQDLYDALNRAGFPNIAKGFPGTQHRETYSPIDSSLSRRILGLDQPGLDTIAIDTYNSLKERFPSAFAT